MEYKETNTGEPRTIDYRGTVESLEDETFQAIRRNVILHNQMVRNTSREFGRPIGRLLRTRIMPRGSRVAAVEDTGGRWRRMYDSYLPQCFGEHFDIYVGEDSTAQYQLQREFDTGLTPGQLAKVDKLKNAIWAIELEGLKKKRGWK